MIYRNVLPQLGYERLTDASALIFYHILKRWVVLLPRHLISYQMFTTVPHMDLS